VKAASSSGRGSFLRRLVIRKSSATVRACHRSLLLKRTGRTGKNASRRQLCTSLLHNFMSASSRASNNGSGPRKSRAAISANRELILLYWDIGRAIVDTQQDKGYGKRVVEILSADLRREFPEMTGLSALNLWGMRAFYLAYAVSDQKLSQLVTESDSAPKRKLEQPPSMPSTPSSNSELKDAPKSGRL